MTYEEKEQQLVSDCVKELRESDIRTHTDKIRTVYGSESNFNLFFCILRSPGESNSQMVSLADELSQKNEELLRHQEEIAQLLSQIVELQHRVKEVTLTPVL